MKKDTISNRVIDIIGIRYSLLLVISYAYTENRISYWNCKCDCGNIKILRGGNLKSGRVKSCGCLSVRRSRERRKYSDTNTRSSPEYRAWAAMKNRCSNEKIKNYPRYGGRGISVSPKWDDFNDFLRDIGLRPSPKHSLDRINNNGNYEPGNCRWATWKEQQRNRSSNRKIVYNNQIITLTELAEIAGIRKDSMAYRLNAGWDLEKAVTQEIR